MHRIMNSASQAARALFFILLAGMAVHVAAQEADRVKRMTLTADLDINVSGKVTAVAVQQQGIAEEVRQLVAQNAKQWAFEPVLVDNARGAHQGGDRPARRAGARWLRPPCPRRRLW